MQRERTGTVDTVQFLREAWDQRKTKVIQMGRGLYEDELGPPEESDDKGDGEWKKELDD
jgi:hypothetical protein